MKHFRVEQKHTLIAYQCYHTSKTFERSRYKIVNLFQQTCTEKVCDSNRRELLSIRRTIDSSNSNYSEFITTLVLNFKEESAVCRMSSIPYFTCTTFATPKHSTSHPDVSFLSPTPFLDRKLCSLYILRSCRISRRGVLSESVKAFVKVRCKDVYKVFDELTVRGLTFLFIGFFLLGGIVQC